MELDFSVFSDVSPSNPLLRTAIFLWLLIKTILDLRYKFSSKSFFIMPLQATALDELHLRRICTQSDCPIFTNIALYLNLVEMDKKNIVDEINSINKLWNDVRRKMVLRSQQTNFFELILIQYILIFFPIVASGRIPANTYGVPILLLFIIFLFWIIVTLIACYTDTTPISWYESEFKRFILIFALWIVFLIYFIIGS